MPDALSSALLVAEGWLLCYVTLRGFPQIRLPERKREAVNNPRPLAEMPPPPGPPPPLRRQKRDLPEEVAWSEAEGQRADQFEELLDEFKQRGWVGPKHEWMET